MSNCTDIERMVPLYKVVQGAMVDAYEDVSKAGVQQLYSHWASRGLKKLSNETLKLGVKSAMLVVNPNTHTATLPIDFGGEVFVGVIDANGRKVPLTLNTAMVDKDNIETIEDEDKCTKCSQNKNICSQLSVTENTVIEVINGDAYERTITKKLYPNGDYYLETRIPVWDTQTDTVIYITQKEFIAALSLKPCGCIDDTTENIDCIKCNSYETYCEFYAPCSNVSLKAQYKIYEESGLIGFSKNFNFSKVYIEYQGFLPKKNGQYQVPEVCLETLIAFVKFKSVENKKNVTRVDRQWYWDRYTIERGNMDKIRGRISLQMILQSINRPPKFDVDVPFTDDSCGTTTPLPTSIGESVCDSGNGSSNSSDTTTSPTQTFKPFNIAVIAGNGTGTPTPSGNTYQNDKLISSIGVDMIIVNNANEAKIRNEFTLDTVTGIISRWQGDGVTPNNWQAGDSLIVPTFFKLS